MNVQAVILKRGGQGFRTVANSCSAVTVALDEAVRRALQKRRSLRRVLCREVV